MKYRYKSNASALLSIRCGACDETYDMTEGELCTSLEERENLVTSILLLGEGIAGMSKLQEDMFAKWEGFMRGKVLAKELVESISSYHKKAVNEEEENCNSNNSYNQEMLITVEEDRFLRDCVLPLMLDLECRTRFILTVYRKYPKFYTLCCEYPHCFACKLDGWHEGTSCEDRQQEELDIEAQFCPDCIVPTIRTDGCSDMLCVCGSVWTWDGDDDDDDSDYN
jgi:hypothetical protein